MMESMIQNPVPTRAEVSDVANAVMDGTDAVMLSAETATGRYPVRAVQAMAQVIEGAEKYELTHRFARHRNAEGEFRGTEEAIAMAVMYPANHLQVKAIVALTESGATPLWMSRIRADIPVYAFTRHEATRRRVTLYRGVYPVIFDVKEEDRSTEALYRELFKRLLELQLVELHDQVILTKGELSGVQGGTNSMQILTVTLD
jgi:pyruvate kinase